MPILSFSSGIASGLPLWAGKKENGHVFLQQAFTLNILLAAVIFLLGLALFFPLKFLGFTNLEYFSFLICAFFLILTNYFDELFIAIGLIDRGGIVLAGFEVIKAILFLLLASQAFSINSLFIVYGGVLALKFVTGFLLLIKEKKNQLIWIESVKKEILTYAVPVSLSNLLSFFLDKSDQLILSFFATKEMFAYYGIGCLIIPPLFILEQSVTKVVLPKLSTHFHQFNKKEIINIYQSAVSDIALLNVPGALGLMVFAKPIILMLFGPRYEAAILFTRMYSLFYLTLIIPPDLLLRSSGDGKSILKLNAIFAPISLFLCLSLSFFYQAYGALVAFLIIKPIRTYFFLRKSKDLLEIPLVALLPLRDLRRYLIISIILSAISLFSAPYFKSDLQWFLIMGSFFFLSFVVSNLSHFKHLIRK
ncbi:MAG: oligosaccharide flippase family protein [Bacteriovoracaceae bacterium]